MEDFLTFLQEAIELANEEAGQSTLEDYEGVSVADLKTLAEAGYLSTSEGFEVRLEDGRKFVITVQQKS